MASKYNIILNILPQIHPKFYLQSHTLTSITGHMDRHSESAECFEDDYKRQYYK
jgi:hypothetical protein